MAQVTDVAIIAHGQPGNPAPLQAAVSDFAGQIGQYLPGLNVAGATLAWPDSLTRIGSARLIYPLFMSNGWFTRTEMPRRLARAGVTDARIMHPLGLDPDLPAIGQALALATARDAGMNPTESMLIVAGHGSGRGERAADACRAFAAPIAAQGDWGNVVTGFIEQAPWLGEIAATDRPAICLPFFATTASHVAQDIPEAMAKAGMTGPVTIPIGQADAVPPLIARRIAAAWAARAQAAS